MNSGQWLTAFLRFLVLVIGTMICGGACAAVVWLFRFFITG